MAQARDTAYFISAIRQISNLESDPAVTDEEVRNRASDAKSALYDLLVGAYEHYAVTSFDFTLAGGIAGNSVTLPSNFYKDVSLTLNPTTTPVTVHRLSSWVDRNNARRTGYVLIGDELQIQPAIASLAGNYQLLYTPLDLPFQAQTTITVEYVTLDISTSGSAVDGTLKAWNFPAWIFDSTYVSGLLNISGAAEALNNDHFLILSVDGANDITTDVGNLGGPVSELFDPSMMASVYMVPTGFGGLDQVDGAGPFTWRFHALDTSLIAVGDTITVEGSQFSDGVYTIATVLGNGMFTTVEPPSIGDVETFLPGVTMTYQETGTVNDLPQIMLPWYEYIQVAGAVALKDKIEQDTTDLEMRLNRLTERIKSMAVSRMEEGGQIGMPDRRNGFWDDDIPPWR